MATENLAQFFCLSRFPNRKIEMVLAAVTFVLLESLQCMKDVPLRTSCEHYNPLSDYSYDKGATILT